MAPAAAFPQPMLARRVRPKERGLLLIDFSRLFAGEARTEGFLSRRPFAVFVACWVVAVVTLLGAVLRFLTLGRQSYWYDEAVTVGLVTRSPLQMLRGVASSESTPPLYYGVAWVWAKVFGTSEVGLRSLSALCGTLAIPLAYVAARKLLSVSAGILVCALAAASPFLVWYSQEARAYSLFVLLAAASLASCAAALDRPSRAALWIWAVSASLALWTEYFALFLVSAEAIALAFSRHLRRWMIAPVSAVAVAGLAVFPLAYHQEEGTLNDWIAQIPLGERISYAARWLVSGPASTRHYWWLIGLVAACAIFCTLRFASRREREGAAIAAVIAGGAFLLPLIPAAVGSDYFLYRNIIASWLPLAIALVAGVATETRVNRPLRASFVGFALALIAISAIVSIKITHDRRYERPDWRGVARCLKLQSEHARAIVVSPAYDFTTLKLYWPSVDRVPPAADAFKELDVVGSSAASFDPPLRLPPSFRAAKHPICSDAIPVFRYVSTRLTAVRRYVPVRNAALLTP